MSLHSECVGSTSAAKFIGYARRAFVCSLVLAGCVQQDSSEAPGTGRDNTSSSRLFHEVGGVAGIAANGTVTVRRSTGADFSPNEDWTHGAYFGSRGTFFADVTGDERADAIVVNDGTVTVRRSTGVDFTPNEDWTHGPYFGNRGTFFSDVTGNGRADAIVSNE